MKKTVTELVGDASPEASHLREQIRLLERERKKLVEIIASRDEFAKQCAASVAALAPYPTFKTPHSAGKSKSPISAVIMLSDWHIGEFINVA